MKKLPIGIQSFSEIRTDNYCYVDKTRLIRRLVDEGKFYFFARPVGLGKVCCWIPLPMLFQVIGASFIYWLTLF